MPGIQTDSSQRFSRRNSVLVCFRLYTQAKDSQSDTYRPMLNIHLQSKSIKQVAEASEMNPEWFNLMRCFGKQNFYLQQIAMLLLIELRSGDVMRQLYVESLTQVLAAT